MYRLTVSMYFWIFEVLRIFIMCKKNYEQTTVPGHKSVIKWRPKSQKFSQGIMFSFELEMMISKQVVVYISY